MGVPLTPIIIKEHASLDDLRGRRLAVDGNGELYQFLALIRQRDGTPLMDGEGRVTSHLVGLFYRSTRLMSDFGLELVFVFDGKPPELKREEIERRRRVKERYEAEAADARAAGELERAYAKSTMTSRLTRDMVDEARHLLTLLGVPTLQAPGEGEAQAVLMTKRGDAWAAASKDYDCLLFGAPRLVRFLSVSGKEFLPSKGRFRPITPEIIDSEAMLTHYGITREGLIDLAILVGTDFNAGIKGIGPKKALKLVQEFGGIEAMPDEIRDGVRGYQDVRAIYLEPEVTEAYTIDPVTPPDEEGLVRFLCDEHGFSRERVLAALGRVRESRKDADPGEQPSLF